MNKSLSHAGVLSLAFLIGQIRVEESWDLGDTAMTCWDSLDFSARLDISIVNARSVIF